MRRAVVASLLAASLSMAFGCGVVEGDGVDDFDDTSGDLGLGLAPDVDAFEPITGDGFGAEMPCTPTEQPGPAVVEDYRVESSVWSCEVVDHAYVVSAITYPDDVDLDLETLASGLRELAGATLVSDVESTYDGSATRDLTIDVRRGDQEARAFQRALLHGHTFIQMQVAVGTDVEEPPALYAKMLRSLVLD